MPDVEQTVKQSLDEKWDDLAFLAYEHYLNFGRGALIFSERDEEVVIEYVAYEHPDRIEDEATREIVETYSPDDELLIQFLTRAGEIRTLRLRAKDTRKRPEPVWFGRAFKGKFAPGRSAHGNVSDET